MNSPFAVDVMLTSLCDMKCPFCFGPLVQIGEMAYRDIKKFISRLSGGGTEVLVFSGGEPTLYPYISDLVVYAKELDFKVVLSTNGRLHLHPLRSDILKNIDWLSVPVDGYDYLTSREMRQLSERQYMNICGLLDYAKQYTDVKIKLGTVVSKKNILYLDRVVSSVSFVPDTWKFYQLSRGPMNNVFYEKYSISGDIFLKKMNKLIDKYKGIEFATHMEKTRDGRHVICNPNGDAIVIYGQIESIVGNFFKDYNSAMENVEKIANYDLVYGNIYETYV